MFRLATPALMLMSTPVLAHSGPHMHPHANDPMWIQLLVGTLVVAALGYLVWTRQ